MRIHRRGRVLAAVAGVGIATLALAGCTGDMEEGGGEADCSDYE